jgi:hypothetical protein
LPPPLPLLLLPFPGNPWERWEGHASTSSPGQNAGTNSTSPSPPHDTLRASPFARAKRRGGGAPAGGEAERLRRAPCSVLHSITTHRSQPLCGQVKSEGYLSGGVAGGGEDATGSSSGEGLEPRARVRPWVPTGMEGAFSSVFEWILRGRNRSAISAQTAASSIDANVLRSGTRAHPSAGASHAGGLGQGASYLWPVLGSWKDRDARNAEATAF